MAVITGIPPPFVIHSTKTCAYRWVMVLTYCSIYSGIFVTMVTFDKLIKLSGTVAARHPRSILSYLPLSHPRPSTCKTRSHPLTTTTMEPFRPALIEPYRVLVHNYPSHDPDSNRLAQAYEYETDGLKRNALIFLGGLGDGPHGIPYVKKIANAIAGESDYAVYEPRLSSAFSAWGYGGLHNDVKEISALVKYLRTTTFKIGRIVLMGHSTGCQDCMYYATHGDEMGLEKVDGFILQGPVSDREAILAVFEEESPGKGQARMDLSVQVAKKMINEGTAQDCMPREWLPKEFWASPVSAYRWFSLASFG